MYVTLKLLQCQISLCVVRCCYLRSMSRRQVMAFCVQRLDNNINFLQRKVHKTDILKYNDIVTSQMSFGFFKNSCWQTRQNANLHCPKVSSVFSQHISTAVNTRIFFVYEDILLLCLHLHDRKISQARNQREKIFHLPHVLRKLRLTFD